MFKLLVPVDGSEAARKLAQFVVRMHQRGAPAEIHLLNVQLPVESGHARMFVSREDVDRYHREEAHAALKPAQEVLDAAGIAHQDHVLVGHVVPSICAFADEQGFDAIIIGTHGRSGLKGLVMGSVAQDVVQEARIPVTLVKSLA